MSDVDDDYGEDDNDYDASMMVTVITRTTTKIVIFAG